MWPPSRKAKLLCLAALLGMPLAVPAVVSDEGRWWRALAYSFEYGFAVLAVVASARTPFRRGVRWLIVVLYALLLAFLFYEFAFEESYRREPALIEDWRLAINLIHFLSEMRTWRWLVLMGGSVVGAVALVAIMVRAFAALQQEMRRASQLRIAAAAAAWSLVGGMSVGLGGPIRVVGSRVVDNYRASVLVRARLRPLDDAERDLRYQDLMKVRLARRPNFYLLVVEAYGGVLTTWDMTDAYRALTARVQARLAAAGYHMRTGYSSAPVHGGRSWLSLATMQTGILVDQPDSFARLQSTSRQIPTLIGFFRSQGYHTASIEPGTRDRPGVGSADLYPHDVRVTAPQIEYQGPPWGYGGIPDQYTLETFRQRFSSAIAEPRYLFYMAVSTHYPWSSETVPSFQGGASWPPLPGMGAIGSDYRRYYMKSIEYEWRALADLLEADLSPDAVIIIVGDHQPRLETNSPGEVTFNTPLHVLSRDGAFVERFAELGFQTGLYAEPGRTPPLVHEGLFSLFVTKLSEAYGTPETKRFAHYFPEGISLRGLNP